jgi:FkbM family methyltransferase
MLKLISVLKTILNHPYNKGKKLKALFTFFKWQFLSRLFKYPIVYPWIGDSKFIVISGDTGLTGNMYCGLHEYEDMKYVLDTLKVEDTFVDIGANLGSYTILAGKVVGANCVSIEPVPQTFQRLQDNILINKIHKNVQAYNIGLSDQEGELYFTCNADTENHVVESEREGTLKVKVKKLDDLLRNVSARIIKIDVEGYELPVLRGAIESLESSSLESIIIELNGSGRRYGFDENEIINLLKSRNFIPCKYNVDSKKLIPITEFSGFGNVIFHKNS